MLPSPPATAGTDSHLSSARGSIAPVAAATAVAAGGVAALGGAPGVADAVSAAAIAALLLVVLVDVGRTLAGGRIGVDAIALVAMAGALALGEFARQTGTLTSGAPVVEEIRPTDGVAADTVLALAASVDQLSPHVLAEALVDAATRRGLCLEMPTAVEERPGEGIAGVVVGRAVVVGSSAWLRERGVDANAGGVPSATELGPARPRADPRRDRRSARGRHRGGGSRAPRRGVGRAGLRGLGVAHSAMVSGDDRATAQASGARPVSTRCSPIRRRVRRSMSCARSVTDRTHGRS